MTISHDTTGRSLDCDLIVKGGVTSGIVYPGAIGAITQRYRLRSIGGASAGAIAAAAAAAMEYGLRSGRNHHAREQMMWLSRQTARQTSNGRSFLQALFQPDPATAAILHLAQPGPDGRLGALLALFGPALAGGLASAALLVLISVGGFARRQLDQLATTIVDNGMGLMTGMAASGARLDGKPVPGLTQWLHETVQSLAGRAGQRPRRARHRSGAGVHRSQPPAIGEFSLPARQSLPVL